MDCKVYPQIKENHDGHQEKTKVHLIEHLLYYIHIFTWNCNVSKIVSFSFILKFHLFFCDNSTKIRQVVIFVENNRDIRHLNYFWIALFGFLLPGHFFRINISRSWICIIFKAFRSNIFLMFHPITTFWENLNFQYTY